MKKLIVISLLFNAVTFIFGQTFTQSGVVRSIDGEELIGVSIIIKGTTKGTVTNVDGEYSIAVNPGDKLQFSYVGFVMREINVQAGKTNVDVEMAPDQTTNLEEVVVVGYGQAKRLTMTGSVSSVTVREIQAVPTSNIQNTLTGKLPGFFSQQRSGQPGKDASDFFIRGISSLNDDGNKPLIIVDDVQYSYDQLQQINVNEIESISILKDASTTAIYGIKGANGVLVVKTRRGETGAPSINLRVESGLQTPIRKPVFLNSYQTALLVNEAYENDGLISEISFSTDDLEAFRNGTDPYGHPDVNWYNEVFNPVALQGNVNLDVSGGFKNLRYFITGGYFSQNGLIKNFSDPQDAVNTNYFYRRFNYRTNLDFDVSKNLNMRLDFSTRFMNINEPGSMNATGEIYNFERMTPYSAPVLNPDGSYAYLDTKDFRPTLNARLANEGYKRSRRNDINILYGAGYKMDFITKGLSANLRLAYSTIDENYKRVSRGSSGYPTYKFHPDATDPLNIEAGYYIINPNQVYAYSTYGITSGVDQALSDLNIQASFNYARVFNIDHDVNAMLLYNRQSRTHESSASVPNNFEGYTMKTGYKYKNKYLIDVNLAYNGTDRFGKDNRFGLFPAIGLGYTISEEDFFPNESVQMLKVRGSYGLVGSDAAPGDRYLYRQVYEMGGGYYFGENPQKYDSYREGAIGNNNVTWEKAKKLDIGLDVVALNRLSFTIDFFHDIRYDQLVTRYDIPLILGIGVSPVNIAKTQNQGFDGSLGYQERIGQVNFNTNLVFSYAKNKVLYKAEAQQRYPWLAETGKSINQPFGYKFIGFYTPDDIALIQAEDSNAPAVPNTDTPVQAGDLKYQDLNGDGVIDDFDKTAIGKPNLPTTTLGWTIGANWKGFSLSLLFQGSFDYSFSIVGTGIESFKSQFQPVHQKRWTLDRFNSGEEIDFPRLTTIPSTVNSAEGYMSDFWLINAWYTRLKTVDISYQLPKRNLPAYINSMKFYANAYNLFTITNYNKYQQDPEIRTNSAGDAYMNQRVFNLGVQVSF